MAHGAIAMFEMSAHTDTQTRQECSSMTWNWMEGNDMWNVLLYGPEKYTTRPQGLSVVISVVYWVKHHAWTKDIGAYGNLDTSDHNSAKPHCRCCCCCCFCTQRTGNATRCVYMHFTHTVHTSLTHIVKVNVSRSLHFVPNAEFQRRKWWHVQQVLRVIRDRPKFSFGCSFGAKTDLKCSFGSNTPFHIRFRPQLYGSWPKLEWVKLMEDLQHWMGLHTLHIICK